MKDAIKKRARDLGFDDCRVTSAASPDHSAKLRSWLAEGQNGEMAWIARNAHKRVDLQQVLAGAKSVVTVAVAYSGDAPVESLDRPGIASQSAVPKSAAPSPFSDSTTQGFHGTIARYARFTDYHDVLTPRLRELAAFIDAAGGPSTRSLWYVDTGPILERDLAQRAGLGFVGKHTNLISRTLGNWIFLAEIITTLELDPDPSERNRCGSCTRCITACPTAAITAPFNVDARRCISYLTIELKGSIPLEFRPLLGNRIYGCDDCLAVCPWNRFARAGAAMKPHARADLDTPDLIELLSLDDAAFKRKFARTPIIRTKRRGLLRNVCVALGNVGDERSLTALERALNDPEPLVREHAAWAIAHIKSRANSC